MTKHRRPVNDDEVRRALLKASSQYSGHVEDFAKSIGCSPSRISEMRAGRTGVSTYVASLLGYELRWVKLDFEDEPE